jgi:putative aminopeptidase FrvX
MIKPHARPVYRRRRTSQDCPIKVGDVAIFHQGWKGGWAIAKSLDDRIGCAISSRLRRLTTRTRFICLRVQEETTSAGHLGLQYRAGHRIAVDVTMTGDARAAMAGIASPGIKVRVPGDRRPRVKNWMVQRANRPPALSTGTSGWHDRRASGAGCAGRTSAGCSIPARTMASQAEMIGIR